MVLKISTTTASGPKYDAFVKDIGVRFTQVSSTPWKDGSTIVRFMRKDGTEATPKEAGEVKLAADAAGLDVLTVEATGEGFPASGTGTQ